MKIELLDIVLFNNKLLEMLKDYQVGEMTEYKKGAISALLEVSEEFDRLLEEVEKNESEGEYLYETVVVGKEVN